MKRTSMRRLWVSSLVVAGAAATVSACSSEDPVLPQDPNPVVVNNINPPAISGGTLLVTDAGLAVAADSDRDVIWVVDVPTGHVASVALQKGDEPGRVVLDGAGRLHVSLRGAGAVATVDLGSRTVLARTPVCSAPRGVAYDAASDAIHVACAGGELVTLHAGGAAGDAPIRSLRFADRDLNDVIVEPGGQLLVTRFRSAEVLVLDAHGALINRQAPPAADPTGFGNMFTPTVAWHTIPSPKSGVLMVHQLAATAPVVISQPGGYGDSGGSPTGCDTTIVQSTISIFGADGSAPLASGPAVVGASVPVDLASDGSSYVIASAGSDSLFFADQGSIENPGAPCTNSAPVAMPGQPVAVAFSGATGYVAQIREVSADQGTGAALVLADGNGVKRVIKLTDVSVANTGHSLFHHNASAKSPLACASCHPQGHEDGHVWSFDTLGARRTQTVSGGVLETAPLHWSGDMTDLPDIMHEVFQHRMGGAEQGPRHVAAFGEWLNSIPAHPASPTGTAAQIASGKAIFERADVGCTTCHNGAHFTNNQTVDVGTGQAFQVPTLIGVAARAPFMHDGCAATLQARFDPNNAACNGGENHGHTSQLSAAEIDDLVAYLETL